MVQIKSQLMGILNVTPDSFSDGGQWVEPQRALDHATAMLANGAQIIDVGGESTRPGADFIPVEDEISRVVPVIARLKKLNPHCIISIDTRKSAVAKAALKAGATMLNDISGLEFSPDMATLAAEYDASLVIMHMRGTPESMQNSDNLQYTNVVDEVCCFLENAATKAVNAGVTPDKIIVDPGIGFSKNYAQNLELLTNIDKIKALGFRVLVGPSRKAFIGQALRINEPEQRKWGTAGVVAYLAMLNIDIIRVHDVREMAEMLKIFELCRSSEDD
jgi:dihydropteroate synthase